MRCVPSPRAIGAALFTAVLSSGCSSARPPRAFEEPGVAARSGGPELVTPSMPLVIATDPTPGDVAPPQPPATESCEVRLVRAPRSDCRALIPLRVTSGSNPEGAARASDGSACTLWNAGGFAPRDITFDLGIATRIDALVLVPEMTPDGGVRHVISFSSDGRTFDAGHRIEAPMRTGTPVELLLPRPEKTRFVRVETTASPSWVAWREVALFRCGGE